MNFRQAPGKVLEWIDTSVAGGFSNFLFVDDRFSSHNVLRRILSLARRLEYASMLIETIDEADCSLLQEENKTLRIRRNDYQSSEVWRLSFWKTPKDQIGPDSFLGYAIVKRDTYANIQPFMHIYECVIKQFRGPTHNNFVHTARSYDVTTNAGTFGVTGAIYAQQNASTTACAHVALRSVLASILPAGDITYSEINGLAGVDHINKIASGGLSPDDMEKVLKSLGVSYRKIVHEPMNNIDLPGEYQREVYGFIESGAPALMGFELERQLQPGQQAQQRHVIPVLGHTFNEDGWVADAQRHYFGQALGYFSSESWLSTYVVHDDNFGPYYCLPRHFLQKKNFRIILGANKHPTVSDSVGIEALGFAYLLGIANLSNGASNRWFSRFILFAKNNQLVLRTVLVSKQNYLAHIADLDCYGGACLESPSIELLRNTLPDHFWMVEASAQELFSSTRRKFGEILISSTMNIPTPPDLSLLLAARLPGIVYSHFGQNLNQTSTLVDGHTKIFSYGITN